MKRLDRLSGQEIATLGSIFDAHPELGVVWGLVQRFHVIFCAETKEAANEAVGQLADAYQAAGVNLGPANHQLLPLGARVAQLPRRAGDQRRLRGRERQDRAARAHGLPGSDREPTTWPASWSCAQAILRRSRLRDDRMP
ncbi:MAG: hypothetical protein ACRD03_13335 [Acidimicrobiales bacterium]